MNQRIIRILKDLFPGQITGSSSFRGEETLTVANDAIFTIAEYLKQTLGFDFLMDLTAVDYPQKDPRFEIVYHFYSFQNNLRLRIKAPATAINPAIASLTPLWEGANWFEREVYDMFGIKFTGHPNMKRILMYDSFEGHPLRKDYPLKKRQPRP